MIVDPIPVIASILKQFRDNASVIQTTLRSLWNDMTGFEQVLETMLETFRRDHIGSTFGATVHIGSHCTDLSRALESGTALPCPPEQL